jgi:hypothetical protein
LLSISSWLTIGFSQKVQLVTLGYANGKTILRLWEVETGKEVKFVVMTQEAYWNIDGKTLKIVGPSTKTGEYDGLLEATSPWYNNDRYSSASGFWSYWEVVNTVPTYRIDQPVSILSLHPDGNRLLINDSLWGVSHSPEQFHLLRQASATSSLCCLGFAGKDQLWGAIHPGLWTTDEFNYFQPITTICKVSPNEEKHRLFGGGTYIDPEISKQDVIGRLRLRNLTVHPQGRSLLLLFKADPYPLQQESDKQAFVRKIAWQACRQVSSCFNPIISLPCVLGLADSVPLGAAPK